MNEASEEKFFSGYGNYSNPVFRIIADEFYAEGIAHAVKVLREEAAAFEFSDTRLMAELNRIADRLERGE